MEPQKYRVTVNQPRVGVNQQDVDFINLELRGEPIWSWLSVFIKDPEEPTKYSFRRLNVITRKPEGGYPIVDVNHMDMGNFTHNHCPQDTLEKAVRDIIEYETEWSTALDTDPSLRDSPNTRAVVGVAEYTGFKEMSLDEIIYLVGVRYSQMQEEFEQTRGL
jgi:hypothetical protein